MLALFGEIGNLLHTGLTFKAPINTVVSHSLKGCFANLVASLHCKNEQLKTPNQPTMKTVQLSKTLLTFVVVFLLSLAGFAGGGDEPQAKAPTQQSDAIVKEVLRNISYPARLRTVNDVEFVAVSFRTEPCGTITVLEYNASHPDFAGYVIGKLENMRVTQTDDNVHQLRINFKRQS